MLAYEHMATSDKKVLIIEDEQDIREAMAEAIKDAGYEVDTAVNGEIGLQKAFDTKPDLILLDLVMPIIDGHEVLRQLREDAWGKDAKVIVLTAMDRPFNVAMAHMSNVDDYIIKAHSTLEEVAKKVTLTLNS